MQGRFGRWGIGQFQEVGVWRREATVTRDQEAERKGRVYRSCLKGATGQGQRGGKYVPGCTVTA